MRRSYRSQLVEHHPLVVGEELQISPSPRTAVKSWIVWGS